MLNLIKKIYYKKIYNYFYFEKKQNFIFKSLGLNRFKAINKIEKIFKSLESIVKVDKKNEKTLLYWYNNILRERSLRLLYPINCKKGYEKIEIINQHEKSLIYNPNLELYIYTLFLKLYK